VLIGQAFGARDIDRARRVVGTAIGSFLPVAALIGVIGWLASPGLPQPARPPAQRSSRKRRWAKWDRTCGRF